MNDMTRVNGFALIAATAAIAIGPATLAVAETPTGPYVVGTGENASVEYSMPSENIVGGALSRSVGSGESATVEIIQVQRTTPGRLSYQTRSGESRLTFYLDEEVPQLRFTQAGQPR
jgi:hypothetical protein